jgi:hypothetical protein
MWEPISETDLLQLIQAAELEMERSVKRFWDQIKVKPQKWSLSPWGDDGGGFWVVAVIGQQCIYYNDIEDGFNFSRFTSFGCIDEYWCNQTELQFCIRPFYQAVMGRISDLSLQEDC